MREVAAVAILNNNHILMGRRRSSKKFTNPGGHLNPGENPLAGAVREVKEETGLAIDPHTLVHMETRVVKKPSGEKIKVHGYKVNLHGKPPTTMREDPDSEVHRWQWIKLDSGLDHIADNLHVPLEDNVLLNNLIDKGLPVRRNMNKFWKGAKKTGKEAFEDMRDKVVEDKVQDWFDPKQEKKAAEIVSGGKADGMRDDRFSDEQLRKGITIEREHTTNPRLAKEIAKDHLIEDKNYYTHLKEMEDKYVEKKAFWQGFEKRAAFKWFKNVGEATENINKATHAGRRAAEAAGDAIPRVEKVINEGTGKALKYLKRGGLAALGIYGAGTAVKAPANIERYKYYHQQRMLSKKQLKQLDKLDPMDGK